MENAYPQTRLRVQGDWNKLYGEHFGGTYQRHSVVVVRAEAYRGVKGEVDGCGVSL